MIEQFSLPDGQVIQIQWPVHDKLEPEDYVLFQDWIRVVLRKMDRYYAPEAPAVPEVAEAPTCRFLDINGHACMFVAGHEGPHVGLLSQVYSALKRKEAEGEPFTLEEKAAIVQRSGGTTEEEAELKADGWREEGRGHFLYRDGTCVATILRDTESTFYAYRGYYGSYIPGSHGTLEHCKATVENFLAKEAPEPEPKAEPTEEEDIAF